MAAPDGDALPSYTSLFPEDEPAAAPTDTSNTTIRRRYTTITLREIYYPSGCPCHPIDKPDRKGKRKQGQNLQFCIEDSLDRPLWVGHARPTMAERTPSQSSASSSSNSSTGSSKTRPWDWFHRRTSSS